MIVRKGARRMSEIPPDVLAELNSGRIATVNLVEWLAVDQPLLLRNVLAQTNQAHQYPTLAEHLAVIDKPTASKWERAIGQALVPLAAPGTPFWAHISGHVSDTVRMWATHSAVHPAHAPTLPDVAEAIRPFAADPHFGVREGAWFVARPRFADDLPAAIDLLRPWTLSPDANIRRFAAECLRPRGVWCKHIDALKRDPTPGLPLLEPLRADPAKYVQDSVANWLNDAAKDHPTWVLTVTQRWLDEAGQYPVTQRIVARARRSMA